MLVIFYDNCFVCPLDTCYVISLNIVIIKHHGDLLFMCGPFSSLIIHCTGRLTDSFKVKIYFHFRRFSSLLVQVFHTSYLCGKLRQEDLECRLFLGCRVSVKSDY